MKAKKFKEFILESRQPKVAWDGAKIWFNEETNFTELLGQSIWQLKASSTTEEKLFKILERIEYTRAKIRPKS